MLELIIDHPERVHHIMRVGEPVDYSAGGRGAVNSPFFEPHLTHNMLRICGISGTSIEIRYIVFRNAEVQTVWNINALQAHSTAQLRCTRKIQRCVPPYPAFWLVCGLVAFCGCIVRFDTRP